MIGIKRQSTVAVTCLMSIGVTTPAWSDPDDPDRSVTRSDDLINEAARQKHTLGEATSIRLKLDLAAVPKEDRFADKSIPTAISPTEFLTDGKLQFTDNMYSLGMMQDPTDLKAPPADHADLAGQATNPVAPLIQLQLQNNMIGESNAGDGYSNAFVVQPVIPWKMGETAVLTRITLPKTEYSWRLAPYSFGCIAAFLTIERVVSSIA